MMLLNYLKAKLNCRKGQGTVEYALATIAVVTIVAIVLIGGGAGGPLGLAITDAFNQVKLAVANCADGTC